MEKTIGKIKEEFEQASEQEIEKLIELYSMEQRAGVVKLVAKYQKQLEKKQKEIKRMEQMKLYEKKYQEFQYICGIDEVGRGPLAGPVVACAIILPKDINLLYINDSKQVSEKKREELYNEIIQQAISVGIGCVDHEVIDKINILQATYEAMRQAIQKLSPQPDLLLNDAVKIPKVSIRQIPIIKGDAKSVSIAAASIVAKVTRDKMMEAYETKYPGYGFASNKGYGSAEHIAALKRLGPCKIHRKSFIKNLVQKEIEIQKETEIKK